MLVVIKKEIETNDHYNPEKANNGGGYHQPLYEGVIQEGTSEYPFNFHNASCGDFGSRYYVVVKVSGKKLTANFGSMLSEGFISSDFEKEFELHVNLVDALNKEFRLDIPFLEDLWEDDFDEDE